LQIRLNILGDKRCKILSMTILADYKSSYLLLSDCKSDRTSTWICNPIKAVQNIVNDDFSGLQILIFAAAGLQIRQNILGDKRCKILSMTILADYKSSYLLLPDCKSGRTSLATIANPGEHRTPLASIANDEHP
ncbi:MAG: hypothetical protein IKH88_18530, partial [Prevotella sp.]|nr:hypothetical protein [Prevotella sp.]